MPQEVLEQAAREMLDWPDASGKRCGMGVMEMSHRGTEFMAICAHAVATLEVAPRALSIDCGVDVLCFGGSKNGLAVGEALRAVGDPPRETVVTDGDAPAVGRDDRGADARRRVFRRGGGVGR